VEGKFCSPHNEGSFELTRKRGYPETCLDEIESALGVSFQKAFVFSVIALD